MKIAVINELYGTKRQGGEEEAIFDLSKKLIGAGLKIDMYSYVAGEKHIKIVSSIPHFLRLIPFFRDIFILPFLGKKLLNIVEKDYDLIVGHSAILFSLCEIKTPTFLICHTIRSQKIERLSKIFPYKILFNFITKKIIWSLESRGFKKATKIIVIKESLKNYLIGKFKIEKEKINIIPNAIDINEFKPTAKDKNNLVLFIGRGTKMKGIDILIKAASLIKAKIIVVTKIIGRKYLENGKRAGIEFLFNVPHNKISEIYPQAKIFILPSRDEEQPLTILEAMSCGVPVIASRIGSGNLVKDNINGLILPENNYEILAEGVNELLKRGDLRRKMSYNNRKLIENKYSWEVILPRYLEILK